MSISTYNEEILPDLLPLYYKRVFPVAVFHKWLCYGDSAKFNRREISFTLVGDIYLRYQAFGSVEEFAQALHKRFPIKIDIGAVYEESLHMRSCVGAKTPLEREVVFDIDMTDYDEVRTCCSGADVCSKCWKFMAIACKILDAALKEDFGFENILWVFSGRRGIHCWVADKKARALDDNQRSAVAENLQIVKGGQTTRKVKLPQNIPYSLQRALRIVDQYFEKAVLVEQDILGTNDRVKDFLQNVEENLRPLFKEPMLKHQTSVERWNAFQNTFQKLSKEQKFPKYLKHMVEEIKLYYSYPRLDINVTKSLNHLLKAPFCVHPKTGKISVPFKAKFVDNFDPSTVPTICQVLDEINVYDAKTKEQEKALMETSTQSLDEQVNVKIKDYKKTSLLKYVTVFNEFLRGLQNAAAKTNSAKKGKKS
jgi:DNA primase small subunit